MYSTPLVFLRSSIVSNSKLEWLIRIQLYAQLRSCIQSNRYVLGCYSQIAESIMPILKGLMAV